MHGLGVWVVLEQGRTLKGGEKSFLPIFELSFLLFPLAIIHINIPTEISGR
jgi:hypothetical protein